MGTHPIFESDFDCLTECHFLVATLISPSEARPLVASSWSFDPTLFPELPKTSVPYAPEKKASDTRDPASTVLSPDSCAREVTSRTTTVLEANRSTETNSRTRTSSSAILAPVSSRWPTPVLTLTVPSFSCAPTRLRGLTENTSSSDRSSMEWTLSRPSSALEPSLVLPNKKSRLPLLVSSNLLSPRNRSRKRA